MRKLTTLRSLITCACFALGLTLLSNEADARPKYLAVFGKTYEGLKEEATKQKCNVCHYGKSKKMRNDWGTAVMKNLPDKNQKDDAIIKEAFTKAEKEKSSVDGKTFGDLIKDGKLPGTPPEDASE